MYKLVILNIINGGIIIVRIIISMNISEWQKINEIKINGIIFLIENKIIIIVQSIYMEIIGNQKCREDNPSFSINFKIIIIYIMK